MTALHRAQPVVLGFEQSSVRVPIDAIRPLRKVSDRTRRSATYRQIAASIAEVGIVEPPAVIRDAQDRDLYHLLDGHVRVAILREQGETEVTCLIAVDDEAFTYNKRISRVATIQEHKMILKAIAKGVPEERLARALNVNIAHIRAKQKMLIGICPEVVDLLRDRHVPINVFRELRFMRTVRQIEAAQAMITMNRYSLAYAKSLLAATPADQMVEGKKRRRRGLSRAQIETVRRETCNLDRELRLVEQDYGVDQLDLVLATGFVTRLLGNVRVVRHLAHHHSDILAEFQKIAEAQGAS
ncbi:plasmid partitioning protein RepB C-terminal domain-containing protein [Allosphingosinicella deserti]|uniref:Chromosome partitioning protein ParB n=1 Tax=Allosphingosinicella deserti TaxID=2116704 RepID=A0A2P7QEH0_9SPHN|nr:plasmid partitioning protein RepB C-terminal domain-containing protein [Sphingomonas deserti]PSJ36372.1 chromosome partitioning protein ParB [Sphingomonas deserti]